MNTEEHRNVNCTVGIIGFGAFGRFMAKHLTPWFPVKVWDRAMPEEVEHGASAPLSEVAACDTVIFAVPWDALSEAVIAARPHLKPGALVLDVTSVKKGPAELLPELLPESVGILCTHPLFGPQSGKDGIAGLRIALCPVRIEKDAYYRVCDFLTDKLNLLVLKTTPDKHDREMARVQAVTHFMSRALREMNLTPSPMATKAYEKLQEFSAIVLSDSWDLFLTIQNGNPYAEEMRNMLMRDMADLEDKLKADQRQSKSGRFLARNDSSSVDV